MSQYAITIDNPKIWSFFKEQHTTLNVESTILLFIDLMDKLSQDVSSTLNNTLAKQLIDSMKQLHSQVNVVSDNVVRLQTDTINNFNLKLIEFKKEYIEDVKMILTINVSEKIAPLLKEQNTIMLDKTHLLINEIIPKNNEILSRQINDSMKILHSSIAEDTNKLLTSTINQKSLDDFIHGLDSKFSNALSTSQSFYSSTEQRLNFTINEIKNSTESNLISIKELSTNNQQITASLNGNVSDMLKKMDNSSTKGKVSENIVYNILQSLYPVSQIDSVGTTKETGDIILTRNNKPKILVEVKNWEKNVVQEEVKKFIHDIEMQKCCGLFIAQNFGIANKEQFQIDIHDGNVLVYIHSVHNDAEKIKVAIDIIDHFKNKLDEFDTKSDIDTISKELLDTINQEYQMYISQKLNILKTIKDFNNKLIKQVEDIVIPSLDNYLSTKYASSSTKFVCQYCEFIGKNQQAMSAHQRGCIVKKQMALQVEPSDNIVVQEQIQIVTQPIEVIVPQETIVPKKKESKKTKLIINNSTN
jgi:hypothetical protein